MNHICRSLKTYREWMIQVLDVHIQSAQTSKCTDLYLSEAIIWINLHYYFV